LPRDGTGWDSQTKSGKGRGTGQGFEILPQDGPGRDFDSLSRPIPEYPRITKGQKGKKNKKRENLKKKKKLSWDFFCWSCHGTKGQQTRKLFCPRTKGRQDNETFLSWDKGTMGCPVPDCPGMSFYLETLLPTYPNQILYYIS
jgi:hypothetical protein